MVCRYTFKSSGDFFDAYKRILYYFNNYIHTFIFRKIFSLVCKLLLINKANMGRVLQSDLIFVNK